MARHSSTYRAARRNRARSLGWATFERVWDRFCPQRAVRVAWRRPHTNG